MTPRKSTSRPASTVDDAPVPFGWYWERVVKESGKVLEKGFVRKESHEKPLFDDTLLHHTQEYRWTPLYAG